MTYRHVAMRGAVIYQILSGEIFICLSIYLSIYLPPCTQFTKHCMLGALILMLNSIR